MLLTAWKQLFGVIGPLKDESFYQIGEIIGHFNFLLDNEVKNPFDYHTKKLELLHTQLRTIASKVIPGFDVFDISLVDMLALLGYVPTFDGNIWQEGLLNFQSNTGILSPLYGFEFYQNKKILDIYTTKV